MAKASIVKLRTSPYCLLLVIALLAFTPVLGQEAKPDYRLREVLTLQHDTEAIEHVSISPDGKRIVACCSPVHHLAKANIFIQGHAKVWDADTGKLLLTIKPELECVSYASFSPDGKRLLTGHIGAEPDSERELNAIKIWDAATGKLQLTTRRVDGRVSCLAFTPDGKRFVSGHWGKTGSHPGELIVWDAKTGKELLSLKGHKSAVMGVAVTPDGKRIVSSSDDETARVWDAKTGKELLVFKGHDQRVLRVAISPDGKRVGTTQQSGAGTKARPCLLIWDIDTGKNIAEIKWPYRAVTCLAFSPDSRRIVGNMIDLENATVHRTYLTVWDTTTGKEVVKVETEIKDSARSVAFRPDGKRIVVGTVRKYVTVWKLER